MSETYTDIIKLRGQNGEMKGEDKSSLATSMWRQCLGHVGIIEDQNIMFCYFL